MLPYPGFPLLLRRALIGAVLLHLYIQSMIPVPADSETKVCDTTHQSCQNKTTTVATASLAFIGNVVQYTIRPQLWMMFLKPVDALLLNVGF